jgi:predicted DNA-binding transcriptional regulator AlpA
MNEKLLHKIEARGTSQEPPSYEPVKRRSVKKPKPQITKRWLPAKASAEKAGCGTTKWWEMVKSGKMPKPTYLGKRSPRWAEDEIDACLESLKR